MRKPWVSKRKNVKGWWCGWYEGGRRHAKAFPNKVLADHFAKLKYVQLNSDVYTGLLDADWPEMIEVYEVSKQVAGFEDRSIYEALLTLKHFVRLAGPLGSRQLTQGALDRFILARGKEVKRYTLNKDISNLRAFLHWGQKKRYLAADLSVEKVKVTPREPRALNADQIKALLGAAGQRSACWRMRVLLLLVTGLRSGDVDKLTVADIDFGRNTVDTRSKKTRKHMPNRPLHVAIMPELARYVAELPAGQTRLLEGDTNTFKKWKEIRERAGLPTLRIHDLRATFSTTLQEAGASSAVAQELLEHSDPRVTMDHYTNIRDQHKAEAVNRMPVQKWLAPPIPRVPEPKKVPPVPRVPG
jgi:integrase